MVVQFDAFGLCIEDMIGGHGPNVVSPKSWRRERKDQTLCYHTDPILRASPTRVVSLAIQKVQLTTLATIFSLHTPIDLLFYSLLLLKYYFSFLFYYIFLSILNQRENKHIYKIIHKNQKQIHTL
jgi:hypothetical protein